MLPPPQQSLPCSARFVGGAAAGKRTERIRGLWRGLNGGCRTEASACLAQLGWSALGRLPSRLSAREHAASHLEGVGAIKVAVGDRHEYACRESLDPFIRPPVRIGRRTALFASEAVKGAGGADGPFPRSAHLPIHRVHARRGGAWKESGNARERRRDQHTHHFFSSVESERDAGFEGEKSQMMTVATRPAR